MSKTGANKDIRVEWLLKDNWMTRPYFGGNEPPDKPDWDQRGLGCQGLKPFLEQSGNPGMFLLAAPPGLGKSSLVRHLSCLPKVSVPTSSLPQILRDGIARGWFGGLRAIRWLTESDIGTGFRLPDQPSVPPAWVDAGDLGLYESGTPDQIDRRMLAGILRSLAETMLPTRKYPRPWAPSSGFVGDKLLIDILGLSHFAVADSFKTEQKMQRAGDVELSFSNKAMQHSLLPIVSKGRFNQKKHWHTHLEISNSTDAIRAEMRSLFLRNRDDSSRWPILVIDEWDRFDRPAKPDAEDSSAGPETSVQGDTAKQASTIQTHPSLEESLSALSRLKGLFADYPQPIVIVGGEELYNKVRRPRGNTSPSGEMALLETIFSHQCFLSPLPAWVSEPEGDTGNTPAPILRNYLCSLLNFDEAQTPDEALNTQALTINEFSQFLLFEIGPNPHRLKKLLSHFIGKGDKAQYLIIHWDSNKLLKSMLGQAISDVLHYWEAGGGIGETGGYTRWQWFTLLRSRAWAFWLAQRNNPSNTFFLPEFTAISDLKTYARAPYSALALATADIQQLRQSCADDVNQGKLLVDLREVDRQLIAAFVSIWCNQFKAGDLERCDRIRYRPEPVGHFLKQAAFPYNETEGKQRTLEFGLSGVLDYR